MTNDLAGQAWDEAQRLLAGRGPWTTEEGAYLESEAVTVLVHPVFDEAGDPSPDEGTVDVVITVRPKRRRQLPAGAGVELAGPAGQARFRPLGDRGQAVFHELPAGEWTARLLVGGSVISDVPLSPAPNTDAEVIPLHSLLRRLPAAAGTGHPPIQATYTSPDGRLTTEVVETSEARLVVRIATADHPGPVALVRLRWGVVAPNVADEVNTLVVPLAPAEAGGPLMAKYDLGSLDQAEAVRVGAAQWAEASELTEQLVRRAFGFSLYGAARRAWERLADAGSCPAGAQRALLEMLGRA